MIIEKLKKAGYRITKSRRAVISILEENEDLNAKEILNSLKKQGTGTDIATVYRVLDLLFKLGIVHRSNFTQQHAHFGFRKPMHMICRNCGKIIEKNNLKKDLKEVLNDILGGEFTAQDVSVEVYGLCIDCSKSSGE